MRITQILTTALLAVSLFGLYNCDEDGASGEVCATFYEHHKYTGKEKKVCGAKIGDLRNLGMNDTVTSIRLSKGAKVHVCEHANAKGHCRTYFRSVSNVGGPMNDQYTYYKLSKFDKTEFSMVIMSDPQYGMTPDFPYSQNDRDANIKHLKSIQALKTSLGDKFSGVIINGDLVNVPNKGQPAIFEREYIRESGLNIYPGMGNHDYENYRDTWCGHIYPGGCTVDMINMVKRNIFSINGLSFDQKYSSPTVYAKNYKGSTAYSWDIGDIHFVQLHNYPTYSFTMTGWGQGIRTVYVTVHKVLSYLPWPFNYIADKVVKTIVPKQIWQFFILNYQITESLNWLKADLQKLAPEKKIVLNMHQLFADGFQSKDMDSFKRILVDSGKSEDILAVFGGHIHQWAGRRNYGSCKEISCIGSVVEHNISLSNGVIIPTYFAGGSHYNKYLRVDFTDSDMTVQVIHSGDGDVKFPGDADVEGTQEGGYYVIPFEKED